MFTKNEHSYLMNKELLYDYMTGQHNIKKTYIEHEILQKIPKIRKSGDTILVFD